VSRFGAATAVAPRPGLEPLTSSKARPTGWDLSSKKLVHRQRGPVTGRDE